MQRFALSILLLGMVVFSGGCGGSATLFVDNDGRASVTVEVDGEQKLYVSSGGHAKCFVLYGEHKITVKRQGSVIFDETKTFEPYADGPNWRHYLLDPDADTKYAVYEYYYYENQKKANSSKTRRKLRGLAKKHWIDVPENACALTAMPIVITSGDKKVSSRQCVLPARRRET